MYWSVDTDKRAYGSVSFAVLKYSEGLSGALTACEYNRSEGVKENVNYYKENYMEYFLNV